MVNEGHEQMESLLFYLTWHFNFCKLYVIFFRAKWIVRNVSVGTPGIYLTEIFATPRRCYLWNNSNRGWKYRNS